MKRRTFPAQRAGFSLVEVLVATALTLILMGAVVTMFGNMSNSIADSRSTLEMSDALRTTAAILQRDLGGVTATMLPPTPPGTGYFEIIEGPVVTAQVSLKNTVKYIGDVAVNRATGEPDSTIGDFDDILMFTTRSADRPFIGRAGGQAIKSDLAEVAWFLRGRTLYRRVLLIAPSAASTPTPGAGYYAENDISVRRVDATNIVANTLGDLNKRENRFAHDWTAFPYDARGWGMLGLPTLRECSAGSWNAGNMPPVNKSNTTIDFWTDPHPWTTDEWEKEHGTLKDYQGSRTSDDVVLSNVIGFDVKVWDPGANAYVDLGYEDVNFDRDYAPAAGSPAKCFHHRGVDRQTPPPPGPSSLLSAEVDTGKAARVYDTWSTHYETEGKSPVDTNAGKGINGLDDGGVPGIVDDPLEALTSPPYPAPLRGIQVKIRTFEPDSRQIREVTIIQDFLPK